MTKPVLKLYGANWCPDCSNTKRFLGEQGVAYDWIDIDADEDANRRIPPPATRTTVDCQEESRPVDAPLHRPKGRRTVA